MHVKRVYEPYVPEILTRPTCPSWQAKRLRRRRRVHQKFRHVGHVGMLCTSFSGLSTHGYWILFLRKNFYRTMNWWATWIQTPLWQFSNISKCGNLDSNSMDSLTSCWSHTQAHIQNTVQLGFLIDVILWNDMTFCGTNPYFKKVQINGANFWPKTPIEH